MATVDYGPGVAQFDPRFIGVSVRNVDAWDGYVAQRNRLLGTVRAEGIRNLVVITGDTHVSWVADLKTDYADAASPVVGTEFVRTSISSGISPLLIPIAQVAMLAQANAHLKFFEGRFRVRALHGHAGPVAERLSRGRHRPGPGLAGADAGLVRRRGWDPRRTSGMTGPEKMSENSIPRNRVSMTCSRGAVLVCVVTFG